MRGLRFGRTSVGSSSRCRSSVSRTAQPPNRPPNRPTIRPTAQPSAQLPNRPPNRPTVRPTAQPSAQLPNRPPNRPTAQPSAQPPNRPPNRRRPAQTPRYRPSDGGGPDSVCVPKRPPVTPPTFGPTASSSSVCSARPPWLSPTVLPATVGPKPPSVTRADFPRPRAFLRHPQKRGDADRRRREGRASPTTLAGFPPPVPKRPRGIEGLWRPERPRGVGAAQSLDRQRGQSQRPRGRGFEPGVWYTDDWKRAHSCAGAWASGPQTWAPCTATPGRRRGHQIRPPPPRPIQRSWVRTRGLPYCEGRPIGCGGDRGLLLGRTGRRARALARSCVRRASFNAVELWFACGVRHPKSRRISSACACVGHGLPSRTLYKTGLGHEDQMTKTNLCETAPKKCRQNFFWLKNWCKDLNLPHKS